MKANVSSVCLDRGLSSGLKMVAFVPTPTLRAVTILVCSLNGILCPLTIAGNGMVFIAVLRKAQLRTIANTSILCLAFADLLVGLLVQPSYLVYQIRKLKDPAWFPCTELLFYAFLGFICVCFSFLTLTLVTLERYLAVFYPYRYSEIITKKRIVGSNCVAWLIWIGLTVLLRLQYGVNSSPETAAISFVIITNFVLTTFVYFRIFRFVQACVSHVGPPTHQSNQVADAQEAKASRTVALITGALFLCYTPTLCASVLHQMGVLDLGLLYHLLYPLGETAVLFNSFLNPLIYVWRTEGIRRSMRDMFDTSLRISQQRRDQITLE